MNHRWPDIPDMFDLAKGNMGTLSRTAHAIPTHSDIAVLTMVPSSKRVPCQVFAAAQAVGVWSRGLIRATILVKFG